MKKIFVSMVAVVIAFSSMAQGQKPQDKKEFKKESFKKDHLKELNLTDAQQAQLKSIDADFKQRMQALHNNDNITVKEQREKRETLAKEHQQKIQTILTAEQRAKLETYKKDFTRNRGFHKGESKAGRFEHLTKDLNLTPDQSVKVKDLNENLQTKIKDVQNNSSLTAEQKKEQVKELVKKHRNNIESMLTQEQKEQLKARLKNHQPNGKSAVK